MASVTSTAAGCAEEHGPLQSLSSPILSKIYDGFTCYKTVVTGDAEARYNAFQTCEGTNGSTVSIGWRTETLQLDLVFRATQYKPFVGGTDWEHAREDKLATPAWLLRLAPDAKAMPFAMKELNQFVAPEHGQDNLKDVISQLTGDAQIRRIQVVGFCVGGSMATLASTWAALQWPTADVRCITFGSLAVGNAAFASAFRWLVSLSYRVIFRQDPIPRESMHTASHKLKHVHGAIYMSDEAMQAGTQPKTTTSNPSMGDHDRQAYSAGLEATYQKTLSREQSTGGACIAQLDVSSLYREALAAANNYSRHSANSLMRKSASLNQQDNFGYTNNDGDLLSPSKRSFGGHVLSRGGSLASDITHLITGAMTRAALAWRAVSKAPAESEDLLVLSQDDRGVPSLRASTEMVRTRDSVFSGAQQQFHAVMQSAGLEPADQPTVQIPELTRRHSRGLPQAVQKEASTALQSTGLMANPVLEDTGATATLVLRAIQTAVESAFQGTLTTARSAVQKSNAAARDALQGPDDGAMPDRIATASALQGKASTASDVLEGTRAAVPCPDATSGLEPPAVHDYAGSIASSCQDPLVGQLHGSPSPHATATSQIRHGAPDSLSGSCSKEGSTCSSEDGGTSNSDARQKHEGSTSLDGTQFARESEDLDNGNDSNPRLAAVEACNAALRGNGRTATKAATAAFSMIERDSCGIHSSALGNLQKVLVFGKISQAAAMARCAYRDEATFQEQTGICNSRLIHARHHHDTKVHVGWLQGGTAVFAFRGTATRQDGLQDVKIFSRNVDYLQELYPNVKAHLGFLQQFAAVCHPDRPELNIAAVLRELSGGQTPTRVICCGHSLGGALATLGATWAALEYPDADVRCISFGSPRVANKAFGRAFSALVGTSLRLVHGFDPVPALPPSMMYKHVQRPIHIRQHELMLQRRPWHSMLRTCISDHAMLKYIQGIYRHMPEGLELLPGLLPQPIDKAVDLGSPTEANRRHAQSAQIGKTLVGGSMDIMKQKANGKVQPERFWMGSLQACFGGCHFAENKTDLKGRCKSVQCH